MALVSLGSLFRERGNTISEISKNIFHGISNRPCEEECSDLVVAFVEKIS